MPVPVRRLTLGLLLAGAVLAGGASPAPVVAQTSCDPSYPDFCIPPVWEVGDLDCADIDGTWFTVYQPDPHYFDSDYDDFGCEWN
jgi:micrococcal nuclease